MPARADSQHSSHANNGRDARMLRVLDAAAGGLVTDRYLSALGLCPVAATAAAFHLKLAGHRILRERTLGYRLIRRGSEGLQSPASVSVSNSSAAGALHDPQHTDGANQDAD